MAELSPYTIAGALPFQPGGNPYAGIQQGLGGLAQQYQQSYNSALAQNQAMYGNILSGYQQVMGNQVGAQQAIGAGYNNLYNTVTQGIQGIDASQRQALADTYAQQKGQARQGLVSRGLGNTTVVNAAERGLALDKAKADIALSNQTAALQAGYQSQLGLAGLGQQNAANLQNTQLGGRQLDWMNSVTAAYPNAQEYNALFSQHGQAQQAAADRAALQKASRTGGAGVGGGVGGATGFHNSPARSGEFIPYGAGGVSPFSSMASFTGGAPAAIYPSYGMGIQQPWPAVPQQYDTYDVETQQGYNTNDPGYQGQDFYGDPSNYAASAFPTYGAEANPSDYFDLGGYW